MYKILERKKDNFKIGKQQEREKSMEETEKKSFLQNKLEECNILSSLSLIYHRKINHRLFLETNFKVIIIYNYTHNVNIYIFVCL